jgi:hypothetical protein
MLRSDQSPPQLKSLMLAPPSLDAASAASQGWCLPIISGRAQGKAGAGCVFLRKLKNPSKMLQEYFLWERKCQNSKTRKDLNDPLSCLQISIYNLGRQGTEIQIAQPQSSQSTNGFPMTTPDMVLLNTTALCYLPEQVNEPAFSLQRAWQVLTTLQE